MPSGQFRPGYAALNARGELGARAEILWEMMRRCRLCPADCRANRLSGEVGTCGATSRLVIAACHPHFGEEPALVGTSGSGTVFFSHCALRCAYCITRNISEGGEGDSHSIDALADMMLDLQSRGCHNINLVTPAHHLAHILFALDRAAARGLRLPLVYNTSGWESEEILRFLDGVVDIYLADFKYADSWMASEYSCGAHNYPEITRAALLEMYRQVGTARPAADGLVYRGLMVRHLVMPNGVAGSKQVFEWIASHLPQDTYVNVSAQYRPVHRAFDYPVIARRPTVAEYNQAVQWAKEAGLTHLVTQAVGGHGVECWPDERADGAEHAPLAAGQPLPQAVGAGQVLPLAVLRRQLRTPRDSPTQDQGRNDGQRPPLSSTP